MICTMSVQDGHPATALLSVLHVLECDAGVIAVRCSCGPLDFFEAGLVRALKKLTGLNTNWKVLLCRLLRLDGLNNLNPRPSRSPSRAYAANSMPSLSVIKRRKVHSITCALRSLEYLTMSQSCSVRRLWIPRAYTCVVDQSWMNCYVCLVSIA